MAKTLYILRHAKAEPGDASMADIERPLAERGQQDAMNLGNWLLEQSIKPSAVACSTSQRTVETLKQIEQVVHGLATEYSDVLYLASCGELLSFLQNQPETTDSVMLIGHNPGMHELVITLMDEADPKAASLVSLKFPTCALAVLTYAGSWKTLAPQSSRLDKLWTPKAG